MKTDELALMGAKRLEEFASQFVGQSISKQTMQAEAAAIRELIAHATEMQEVMKAKDRPDKFGWWFRKGTWIDFNDIDQLSLPLALDMLGGWFGPFNFALTETPRPATTGEMMGEG